MAAMQVAWLFIAGSKMVECIWICRGKDAVAQLDRAPICAFRMEVDSNLEDQSGGRRFKSCRYPFYMADIAQLVEHLLVAQGVVGSNPTVRP